MRTMRPPTGSPVHRLREYLAAHDLDGESDGILLARFATERDESAFTALVRRHTPLVFGTARRIIGNAADAEDVLQAVFLTLARKATTVRCHGTLAPWLYRVTCRAAGRLRKRSRPVRPVPESGVEVDPLAQMSARELCSAIDAEVARLSARLRAPVVLCCLEGLTRDEAAARLGWSPATLKRRLARGRALLDRRLRARNITLAAALAPAVLGVGPPVAAEVVKGTVETALGRIGPPERVVALCGLSVMTIKTAAMAAIACGAIGIGILLGLHPSASTPPGPPAGTTPPPAPQVVATRDAHGDPLPAGAVARIGTTRFRHDQWVNLATWSPDSKYIASAAGSTLIVWDADTGRELARKTFDDRDELLTARGQSPELPAYVTGLAWAPDGKALAIGFRLTAQVLSWRLEAKRLAPEPAPVGLTASAFGGVEWADGRRLVTVDGARLTVTDLAKQSTVATFDLPDGQLERMVIVPGRTVVAAATEGLSGRLRVFDWTTPDTSPKDLGVRATRLAVSGDGRSLAAAISEDDKSFQIEIWDTTSWASRRRFTYPAGGDVEIRALALSPDGKTLVTGASDKTLRWWDMDTGKETRRMGPGWVYFNGAAFRPDGKVLMSVSHENHIRLWDVATGKELRVASGPAWPIPAAASTPDGRCVLTVSDHTVYAHDAATGRELWHAAEHTDTVVQVIVTPDGKTAISSGNDGRIICWDIATGRARRRIETARHATDVIAMSPDGRTLAALGNGDFDRTVRRRDVATGKAFPEVLLPVKDARYVARAISYTPDGKGLLITSGTETQVLVFDPDRKEVTATYAGADGGLNWSDLTADGRTVAASTAGGSIYLWETATTKPRLVLKNAGYTTCLAFSPDGRFLAVANDGLHRLTVGDRTVEHTENRTVVRLLNSYTGREIHRFPGHTGNVNRLSWLSNDRLLSTSQDASGLIWDVAAVRSKLPTDSLSAANAERAADALGGPDGAAAYQEMARLVASPATAVTALRTRLKPVPAADSVGVSDLIADLDSPQFAVRDRAGAQLARFGDGVEGALRRALDGKLSAEARDRVERLLSGLKAPGERLRQVRILEVLERIGNAEARALLTEVAGGADGAWLTREAAASLARLTHLSR